MKTFLTLLSLATLTLTATAADVSLGWVNGDNPAATTSWLTIVYVATSPNAGPTNFVSTTTVNWPTNQCTVTNLQAGRRYYFTVAHTDLVDISDVSNEVNSKTKIAKPNSLTVIP